MKALIVILEKREVELVNKINELSNSQKVSPAKDVEFKKKTRKLFAELNSVIQEKISLRMCFVPS